MNFLKITNNTFGLFAFSKPDGKCYCFIPPAMFRTNSSKSIWWTLLFHVETKRPFCFWVSEILIVIGVIWHTHKLIVLLSKVGNPTWNFSLGNCNTINFCRSTQILWPLSTGIFLLSVCSLLYLLLWVRIRHILRFSSHDLNIAFVTNVYFNQCDGILPKWSILLNITARLWFYSL